MREFKQKMREKKTVNCKLVRILNGKCNKKHCPKCRYSKEKTFTPYAYKNSKGVVENVDDAVFGYCDRLGKCKYHQYPTGEALRGAKIYLQPHETPKEFLKLRDYIYVHPMEEVERCMTFKDRFSQFLFKNFDYNAVKQVLQMYKVGFSEYYTDSTIFWQIDNEFDVRAGKIVKYGDNGKRVKGVQNWVHAMIQKRGEISDFNMCQCLFGEHLIRNYDKIAVVEAEKTAIVAMIDRIESGKPDDVLFVATGGVSNFNPVKFDNFRGKQLYFYPDSEQFASKRWAEKMTVLLKDGFTAKLVQFTSCIKDGEVFDEGSDVADIIFKRKGILK